MWSVVVQTMWIWPSEIVEKTQVCTSACLCAWALLWKQQHTCVRFPDENVKRMCSQCSVLTAWLNITKELISFLRLHITLDRNVCSIEIGNVVCVSMLVHALLILGEWWTNSIASYSRQSIQLTSSFPVPWNIPQNYVIKCFPILTWWLCSHPLGFHLFTL